MAVIEFQVSPRDDVYIWREWYKKGYTVPEMIRELQEREDPAGYRIDMAFGDSADPAAIDEFNLYTPCIGEPEAKQNWRRGVECVKRQLKLHHDGISYDDYERPIEVPKLFVDPDCHETIKEFEGYRAKKGREQDPGKEEGTTGVALKRDDHAMDAIRYGLMHVMELGATSSLYELMGQYMNQLDKHQAPLDNSNLWLPDVVGPRSMSPVDGLSGVHGGRGFFGLTDVVTRGKRF